MDIKASRRPRFRRAAGPPAFRITDGDVQIVRLLARHRFLRSTHIAALVGRSLDRVNDRLLRLFHAGYVDRPRGQLDRFPDHGSAPIAYALADGGARLLNAHGGQIETADHNRRNREAGRPFIEHELEVMDFYVSLQLAHRARPDLALLHPEDLISTFPQAPRSGRHAFALSARLTSAGITQDVSAIPDLAFGIRFLDESRRCFLVEIDRGTMPVTRGDIRQTSIARKMNAYLAAYAAREHEKRFGWKTFRVLVVTPHHGRLQSMLEIFGLPPMAVGVPLFLFAVRQDLCSCDPLTHVWRDGAGHALHLAPR